jgi:hypothetical protein
MRNHDGTSIVGLSLTMMAVIGCAYLWVSQAHAEDGPTYASDPYKTVADHLTALAKVDPNLKFCSAKFASLWARGKGQDHMPSVPCIINDRTAGTGAGISVCNRDDCYSTEAWVEKAKPDLVFHYACHHADTHYSLTVNDTRKIVKMQEQGGTLTSFRVLKSIDDPEVCARGGWSLSGGTTFCYFTQGEASLHWQGHDDLDCDQADTE